MPGCRTPSRGAAGLKLFPNSSPCKSQRGRAPPKITLASALREGWTIVLGLYSFLSENCSEINAGCNTHQLCEVFSPAGLLHIPLSPEAEVWSPSESRPISDVLLPGPAHFCWARPTAPAGACSQPSQIALRDQAWQKLPLHFLRA